MLFLRIIYTEKIINNNSVINNIHNRTIYLPINNIKSSNKSNIK